MTFRCCPIFNIAREGGRNRLARPDFSVSSKKGFEIAEPYHWQIGPNRDLTLTPHVYTGVFPAIEAKYRQLDSWGAFQVGGFLTYGTIESVDPDVTSDAQGLPRLFRSQRQGQLDPAWSITTSLRAASDKTITRRYDITNDDRLRNVRQRRADQPEFLHLDRRLGIRRAARRGRPAEADPDRPARDRCALPHGGSCSAESSQIQANSLSIIRHRGTGHAARVRQRANGT